jgi:hypothetical protein
MHFYGGPVMAFDCVDLSGRNRFGKGQSKAVSSAIVFYAAQHHAVG